MRKASADERTRRGSLEGKGVRAGRQIPRVAAGIVRRPGIRPPWAARRAGQRAPERQLPFQPAEQRLQPLARARGQGNGPGKGFGQFRARRRRQAVPLVEREHARETVLSHDKRQSAFVV